MTTPIAPSPRRYRGIRWMLMLPVLLVILPTLAQVGLHLQMYRQTVSDEYAANLEMARAVAVIFESYVEEIRRDELALGERLIAPPRATPSQAAALLRSTVERYPAVESFSWVSSEGRVVASTWPAAGGIDVSQERWFADLAAGGDWTITDVARSRDPQERTFEIAQSLRDPRGKLLGVVVATVHIEQLEERVQLQRAAGRAYAIVDRSGWLVYRFPGEKVAPIKWEERDWGTAYPQVREALEGREVTGLIRDRFDGQRRVSAFVPIPSVGWAARASRLESASIGLHRRHLAQDPGLLLGLALIAVILAAIAARRITLPLEQLEEHAREVAQGRLDRPVQVSGPAELVRLAETFNRMTQGVQSREHEHARLLELERERAQNGRLLEAVQEHTFTLLAYLDRDLRFRHANSQYCQFLGRPCEELVGKRYDEVSDSEVALNTMTQARDTGQAVHLRDVFRPPTARPKVGPTSWDVSVVPVKDERGGVEGLVVSVLDVTERVKAREDRLEIERTRVQLAETIAAETNHRMKNNLLLLSGVLQLQLSTLPADSEAATQLRDAVSRIHALSAVHEQLYRGHPGSIELGDVLRRLAEIGAGALSRENVTVTVEADPVFTSPKIGSILAMVANELLTNALKHGAPNGRGQAEIQVKLHRASGQVTLSVWNAGNPVPEDFDPTRHNGLGLKLTIGLIREQLRGSVTLRPQDGGTLAEVLIDESVLGNDAPNSPLEQ